MVIARSMRPSSAQRFRNLPPLRRLRRNLELDQAIAPAKCLISRRNDRRAGPI